LNVLIRATPFDFLAQTWLSNTATALPSLVAVALWSFFGFGVITYLAGLATIPEEVLEAAEIDGAGYWAKLLRIIVPLMKSVIGYWTVLCASGMLVWMFPLIYALTQGGPGNATMLPEFLVFLTTFQFLERGYGTTVGMALFVFVALISGYTVRHMYVQATRGDHS
jgi:ABC-type sugar transport system permease subunit